MGRAISEGSVPAPEGSSGETERERLNRELDQLLGELRVALPGVQVLFAFLLTVPFTSRFHDLPESARDVYFVAVILVAVASILLIAPTVHHRLRFRRGVKVDVIKMANRFAIAATGCIAVALGAAIYVAGEAAFPGEWVRWIGPIVVAFALVVWFAVPFGYHSKRHGDFDQR